MKKLILILLILCPSAFAQFPTYKGSGTFTAAAAGCTAPMPSGGAAPANGDILILVVTTENQDVSLTTANGFTEGPDSPQGAGTAATDPANRVEWYWKRAVGGDSSPVTNDSGNHQTCQIHAFSTVHTSGDPWDVTSGGNDGGSNDTSAVMPGDTTTVANTLIVLIQGTSFNGDSTAQCGSATNTDLASISERTDNTSTQQLGGGHCLITGTKATAGSYGNTTLTLANTSFKGAYSIALKPALGNSVYYRQQMQ